VSAEADVAKPTEALRIWTLACLKLPGHRARRIGEMA
jgi:hypothetical protein